MKPFSRIFALCIAGALTLSTLACSSGEPKETAPSGTSGTVGVTATGTAGPTPPTEPDPQPVSLTVAGVPLENYTIVYANHPYKNQIRKIYTEYDFYKLTADEVAKKIAERTGVTLTVARDTKTDESEYEILIGPTNRSQSDLFDSMDVYDYACKVDGTKLVVGGGYNSTHLTGDLKTSYCYASTYHAWDYVDAYLAEHAEEGKVDLPGDFSLSGSREITTVACIGDSITEGFLSTDWNIFSYPAALQRILWQDYLVLNYGNSGRTMRNDLVNPYKGTPQYNFAKRQAKTFDAALIMLGTNDSHFDRAWTAEDDTLFNDSAMDLAGMLTKANKDMKLVVMSCPVYYGTTENSGTPRVRYLQGKLVSLYKDAGYDASFYNMHAFTETKLGAGHFPDQLHPDDEGYYLMASGLSEMIPSLFAGTWNEEPELPEYEEDVKPGEKIGEGELAVGDNGGNWTVDGSDYSNAARMGWPNFSVYGLGNSEKKVTLSAKVTVSSSASEPNNLGGDIAFLFAAADRNSNKVLEETGDYYYLVCVSHLDSDVGTYVGIERNAGGWGNWISLKTGLDFKVGDEITFSATYDPATATITVSVNGTELLRWTDEAPLTGTGYGLASKVTGGTFSDVSATVEG